MNPDQDYSAVYFVLETDGVREGHGLTFRFERSNEIRVASISAVCDRLVGVGFDWMKEGMRRFLALRLIEQPIALDRAAQWCVLAHEKLPGFSIEMKPHSIAEYTFAPKEISQ
jgi:hypothetical protein